MNMSVFYFAVSVIILSFRCCQSLLLFFSDPLVASFSFELSLLLSQHIALARSISTFASISSTLFYLLQLEPALRLHCVHYKYNHSYAHHHYPSHHNPSMRSRHAFQDSFIAFCCDVNDGSDMFEAVDPPANQQLYGRVLEMHEAELRYFR
jgi:hypothetical protein